MSDQPVVGPISVEERIQFIDILRGMALFGILAANMRAFNAPLQAYGDIQKLFPALADVWAQGVIDAFISGKFITLFSFLFGLGFAVQLTRAEARGAKFTSFYPRRLAALACFGLIHGIVIWAGDILLTYAATGFLLLWFRKAQQKTLVIWMTSIISLPIVGMIGFWIFRWFRPAQPRSPQGLDMEKVQRVIETYAHGSPLAILQQNWRGWVEFLPFNATGLVMLCVFLAGLYVWRKGIVQSLGENRDLLKRVCGWTLPIGLALNIAAVAIHNLRRSTGRPTLLGLFVNIVGILATPTLSCGYATGLALLYLKESWRPWLQPFAAVGRMALTNYLMQSVVCVLFYYSFTTGLYGKVGPAVGLVPTLVLYSLQVISSNWWVARYRFGPMEWLWRGLTYGKFPAMRPQPAAEVAGTAEGSRVGPGLQP